VVWGQSPATLSPAPLPLAGEGAPKVRERERHREIAMAFCIHLNEKRPKETLNKSKFVIPAIKGMTTYSVFPKRFFFAFFHP
jgi:hypothetical protein